MATIFLVILTAFVVMPSANYHEFNGIPLDSLPTYLLLLSVAPILAWPWLRGQWRSRLGEWPARRRSIAAASLCVGVMAKGVLFFGGGYDGFAGCYRSLDEDPRVGLCESSYGNPFGRFQATRIDQRIDFRPTDWNLSFINDNRFNYYNWIDGTIPRGRLPFSANWRGTVSHPVQREIAVTYVGAADLLFGSRRIRLEPSYNRPRTVDVIIDGGPQRLWVAYEFDDESRVSPSDSPEDHQPVATFRLRVKETAQPLRAAAPQRTWRAIAYAVDVLSLSVAVVLLWFYGSILLGKWRLLLIAGTGVWLVYTYSGSFQILTADGIVVLSLLSLGVAALSRRQDHAGLCAAYWGVVLLLLAHEATLAESLESVLLRAGGTDALTYESFAREILDTWSLRGGEDLFYYQPFFRYVRFTEHLLLGDGDVIVAAFSRSLLTVSVFWMIWTFGTAGYVYRMVSLVALVLLLVLVNSVFIADLLRQGHTEYPTLVALPLITGLLFGPHARHAALGSGLVGVALITRINQAPALLWLLGVRLWRVARRRREVALASVVVVAIGLLPAAHNLYYGGELVFTTTSIGISDNLVVRPSVYWVAWRDEEARDRVTSQLGRILYDASSEQRHPQDGGGLRPVFRGLQILWMLAILSVFVSGSVRMVGSGLSVRLAYRPLRGTEDLHHLLILSAPMFFLAPHLFYEPGPRKIVIAYLAMAATALYAAGVVRPCLQSGSVGDQTGGDGKPDALGRTGR